MDKNKFDVGDIVSLNSHPYFENHTNIIITGDHQSVPPLMVIGEILNNTKDQFDEITQELVISKQNCECKCYWFSTKSNQYEETWISSQNLKLIQKAQKEDILDSVQVNSLVVFKTVPLELKKMKSSITVDGYTRFNENVNTNITSLLSFVGPVMEVLTIKRNEEKVPKFDSKTGNQKRFIPNQFVKCKWFSHSNDKMTEKILPIEVLQAVPKLNQAMLNQISADIEVNNCYRLDGAIPTIFKPAKITYRSGLYFLNGLNYVSNRVDEILIDRSFETIADCFLYDGPKLDDLAKPTLAQDARNELIDVLSNVDFQGHYFRIVYVNRNDVITTRTLKDTSVLANDAGEPTFLRGHCFNRKEIRTFRIDRIQRLQVLNLKLAAVVAEANAL